MKYSVIIIAYNEEDNIRECLKSVKNASQIFDVEILVSDGGSTDNTLLYAKEFSVIFAKSNRGRGIQCNEGAKMATGDILLFLHADSTLPVETFKILTDEFKNENKKIGTFRLGFPENKKILKFYTFFSRFDSIFTTFGDQCIVIRKDFFYSIGTFPDWVLFEDVHLLREARKITKINSFPAIVQTSARRFTQNGLIRQQLRNFFYIIWYLLGATHKELEKKYNPVKHNVLNSLIIFARYPQKGKVKTRLAKNIGDDHALKLYQLCLYNIIKEVQQIQNIERCIYISDKTDLEQMQNIIDGDFRFYSQSPGNLGLRMKNALSECLNRGSKKIIIIGTDVPDLSKSIIKDAFNKLDENEIVIGPSYDGGYYLLGSKFLHNELFEKIQWSTNMVFEHTLKIAQKLGLKIHTLPHLHDIDTGKDLDNWYSQSKRIYSDEIEEWYKSALIKQI